MAAIRNLNRGAKKRHPHGKIRGKIQRSEKELHCVQALRALAAGLVVAASLDHDVARLDHAPAGDPSMDEWRGGGRHFFAISGFV